MEATLHDLEREVGLRLRFTRLGHAQRGGRPSGRDRLLAAELAEEAVRLLAEDRSGALVWQGTPRLLDPSAPTRQEV